jgi:hypothetical protein
MSSLSKDIDSVEELVDTLISESEGVDKVFLQMVGSPASGKSTLTIKLLEEFNKRKLFVTHIAEPAQKMIDNGDKDKLGLSKVTLTQFLTSYLIGITHGIGTKDSNKFAVCDSSIALTTLYDDNVKLSAVNSILDAFSSLYNVKFLTIYLPRPEGRESEEFITEPTTEFGGDYPLYLSEPEKALIRLYPWQLKSHTKYLMPNRRVRVHNTEQALEVDKMLVARLSEASEFVWRG